MLKVEALQKLPKSLLRHLLRTSGVLLGDLHKERRFWENGRTVTREICEEDPEYAQWSAAHNKCLREAEWQTRIRAVLNERRPAIQLIGLDSFLDDPEQEDFNPEIHPQTANESLLSWGVSAYNKPFGVLAFEKVLDDT